MNGIKFIVAMKIVVNQEQEDVFRKKLHGCQVHVLVMSCDDDPRKGTQTTMAITHKSLENHFTFATSRHYDDNRSQKSRGLRLVVGIKTALLSCN